MPLRHSPERLCEVIIKFAQGVSLFATSVPSEEFQSLASKKIFIFFMNISSSMRSAQHNKHMDGTQRSPGEGPGDLHCESFLFWEYLSACLKKPVLWPPWACTHKLICISKRDSSFKCSPGNNASSRNLGQEHRRYNFSFCFYY